MKTIEKSDINRRRQGVLFMTSSSTSNKVLSMKYLADNYFLDDCLMKRASLYEKEKTTNIQILNTPYSLVAFM